MKINTNFVNQFWIASKINNFFQDGEVDPKQSIIKLRELCELLLSHLSTFSDDDEVNEETILESISQNFESSLKRILSI